MLTRSGAWRNGLPKRTNTAIPPPFPRPLRLPLHAVSIPLLEMSVNPPPGTAAEQTHVIARAGRRCFQHSGLSAADLWGSHFSLRRPAVRRAADVHQNGVAAARRLAVGVVGRHGVLP